jgi:hypothetical protein
MRKKIAIIILLIIGFVSIININGQNTFVLIDLQEGENFIYREVGTSNYIQYNITERIPIQINNYGQGIYGNIITSNTTTSLDIISTGRNLSTTVSVEDNSSSIYILQFDEVINTSFINSAKGNMLINGTEFRIINIYNESGLLFTNTGKITVNFLYADRALSILTGNPAWDKFYLSMIIDKPNIHIEANFEANVRYDVSYPFNATYQGNLVSVRNITELFSFTSAFLVMERFDNNKNPIEVVINRFNIKPFQNIYSFAENIGLPIYIEKFNSIESKQNNKIQSFVQSSSLNEIVSYQLEKYSWNIDNNNNADNNVSKTATWFNYSIFFSLVIIYTIKKRMI